MLRDVNDMKACDKSITGAYLSGKREIPVPKERRKGNGKYLKVIGASENNLKNIDVKFPSWETYMCYRGIWFR